jgi:imidazolonepropionase-like amidohydrolase
MILSSQIKTLTISVLTMSVIGMQTHSIAQTSPAEGIRKNTPTVHAFINACIVQSPGKVIEKGALVIRDGVIQSAGTNAPVPSDARVWDMKGMTIYPGLIDSYSDYGLPKPPQPTPGRRQAQTEAQPPEPRGASYWNKGVIANQNAAELFTPDAKAAEKLRSQGITSALIMSPKGLFKGTSALVNLGDGKPNDLIIRPVIAQHVLLGVPQGGDDYPGSLMGAIALIRQVLNDADWYQKAQDAYAKNPSLKRPETNDVLAALKDVVNRKIPIVIETGDELDVLRAQKIAQEFSLDHIIRGSGNEYKRLDAIKATQRTVILPINFPEVPTVQTQEDALQVTLEQLRYWDEAPENPKRLQEAGVQFAFTSSTLKEPGTFLGQVRKAVERGLAADAALAALTTTPSRLFGVEKQLGTLEPGKVANFIITDGDLFAEKTVVRESWIDGKRYEVKPIPENDSRGKWDVKFTGQSSADTVTLNVKGEVDALQGAITKKKDVKLTNVSFAASRLSLSFTGDSIGYKGVVRMTAVLSATAMNGSGEWSDGTSFTWSATRLGPYVPEPDTTKKKELVTASFPPVYPPGEFGRPKLPEQPASVFVKGATIWTMGSQGKLESADMLINKGKIVKVGKNLEAPAGAVLIDGTGKHVTPGIIDPHSHTAGTGGLNEAGQAISAETRIGDVIDCDDIDIYRELAGGTTTIHVLHGSANPIGGQCQLIKLRWGMLPEEMKFEGAPPTIKFALGENVKQSNWGDRFTTRYPQTRMGVEQILRDEFTAALDYEKAWQRWEKEKTRIPPRRDLELDAILEIIRGKRFIHCHSYRQDEILATMRVAEDFGFRIKVFQHILEGYKVADVMAKHGAGGSCFTDWWAYKLEVYDAIPYNGVLMHDQGVLTSFNSDSDELARRLNLEAAKAVKYGGLSEEEAFKFVTINPAKQLMVDNRVGSLEPGKDADFVVWSGNPLSTYTMCEQTWIDGRKFFDRQEDRQLYQEAQHERAVLIQKALAVKKVGTSEAPPRRGDEYDHPHHLSIGEEGQQ